jgi:hypothetical protein
MSLCLCSAIDGLILRAFPVLPKAAFLGCVLLPDFKVASFDNEKNIYIHDIQTKSHIQRMMSEVDISSICVSGLGKPRALFLRSDGLIEMIDTKTMDMVKVFKLKNHGHFVIRATFGGKGDEFVASGSEGERPGRVVGDADVIQMAIFIFGPQRRASIF